MASAVLVVSLLLLSAPLMAAAQPLIPPGDPAHAYVAMCVVTRDDNRDIREWVEYHRRLGAGRIYVNDHNSTVAQSTELAEYIESGLVHYTALTEEVLAGDGNPQHRAYTLCLERYGASHTWMAFIDTDEFVIITSGGSLPELLRPFEAFGGLGLNWLMYGSAGHRERPQGGILHNYDKCNPETGANIHIKTILQPARARGYLDPHHFTYRDNHRCVAVDKSAIPGDGPFSSPARHRVAYVAHFITKSWEDWQRKVARGSGDGRGKKLQLFNQFDTGHKQCARVDMYAKAASTVPPAVSRRR